MTTSHSRKAIMRKFVLPMIVGGLAGFLASVAFLRLTDFQLGAGLSTSREIAGLAGLVYILMGCMVLVGALSPGVGAKFLNVEDADELREQKSQLTLSSAAIAAMGGCLMLLALTGPGLPVPSAFGVAGAAALIAVTVILSVAAYKHTDELQNSLSRDAVVGAFYMMLALGGGWAVLAHTGFVPPMAPIDWLTMFYATVLVGTFYQVWRRGMLMRGPN